MPDPDADKNDPEVEELLREATEAFSAAGPPKKLTVAERRRKGWELKMAGKTLPEVAEELGISWSTAQKDMYLVSREIDVTKWLDAEVKNDLQALTKLIGSYWRRAVAGDLAAAQFVLQVYARKHKLLGMDAPKKVDIRGIIALWAESKGLGGSIDDVIEAVYEMIPEAE